MLTESEVYALWYAEIAPAVYERWGPDDGPAWAEAFNDWTDQLCKEGQISPELYDSIEHPRPTFDKSVLRQTWRQEARARDERARGWGQ